MYPCEHTCMGFPYPHSLANLWTFQHGRQLVLICLSSNMSKATQKNLQSRSNTTSRDWWKRKIHITESGMWGSDFWLLTFSYISIAADQGIDEWIWLAEMLTASYADGVCDLRKNTREVALKVSMRSSNHKAPVRPEKKLKEFKPGKRSSRFFFNFRFLKKHWLLQVSWSILSLHYPNNVIGIVQTCC